MQRADLPYILRKRLREPLPGAEAQYRMAPAGRQRTDVATLSQDSFRHSAVLILICRTASGGYFIPLIERAAYEGVHSSQISFPGGKYDEADQSLENTALRECAEEIGLKDSVEMIGSLTRLYIPVSRFLVHPFVGLCSRPDPRFTPHAREVKAIVHLGIDQLLKDDFAENGTVKAGNLTIKSPYFNLNGHKIWGATAMVLSELKEVIITAG